MPLLDASTLELVASGLRYPEGPMAQDDGSVLLVEIMGEQLTRVLADGTKQPVVRVPGGPNGAAPGPGGQIYVCNNGGFAWTPVPTPDTGQTLYVGTLEPASYRGGRIERVDPAKGTVETLYRECSARLDVSGLGQRTPRPGTWEPPFRLRGPDDLVFDGTGHFWFTDFGKARERDRDVTGVYYAAADGSGIRQVLYPLDCPNGIGISPDGKRLYVSLTWARAILYWELDPDQPGTVVPNPLTLDGSYLLSASLPPLDSLALDQEGNVYVASLIPKGNTPFCNGGITVVSPLGETLDYLELAVAGLHTPLPSRICFGGPDRQTAFVTCGASGLLLKVRAQVPGLPLAHA